MNLSAVGWTLNIVTGKSASGSGKLVGTPVPILAVAGKNVTCSYVGALANFNSSTAPPQPGPIAIIDDLTSTGVGSCQKTTGPVAYKFADGVIATLTIAAPLLAAGGTQMYFLVNTMGLAPDMAACTPIAGSLQIPAVCTDDVLINNGGFASASYVVGAGK